MAETKYSVTIKRTMKGVETWECFVSGESVDETLVESDRLVAELRKRYTQIDYPKVDKDYLKPRGKQARP